MMRLLSGLPGRRKGQVTEPESTEASVIDVLEGEQPCHPAKGRISSV